MNILRLHVPFYDAVNIIHDAIITINPYTAKFVLVGFRNNNALQSTLLLNSVEVLRGLVVKCFTRNPGVLGSSRTEFSGFYVEVSLGKTLLSPSLVLVKPGKDMDHVSCHCELTEIMSKAT